MIKYKVKVLKGILKEYYIKLETKPDNNKEENKEHLFKKLNS